MAEAATIILQNALGPVRNQLLHLICWACVLCNLISAIRVLHGLDPNYVALSPMFACKNISREKFEGKLAKVVGDDQHACSGNNMRKALQFAKKVGVRREREGEELDCLTTDKFTGDEELIKIKEFYYYPTIEEAMERVREGYPVAAYLSLYDGWDKTRPLGEIYRGPENGQPMKRITKHAVIIFDFQIVDEVKCAICKLSNGEIVGYYGYLAVSLQVMTITVAGAKKKDRYNWCPRKPRYLLDNFFSLDVDVGS